MQDKRRSHRLTIELPLSFKARENQKHISIGTTLDISAVGICLKTRDEVAVGKEMEIAVKLPTGESLNIKIKVIRVKEEYTYKPREYQVGVKLLDTGTGDESKFVKFYASKFLSSYSKIIE